MYQRARK